MTYSVVVVKDNEPRVVGTLWADDEANARVLATLHPCLPGEQVTLLQTEKRELPFQLSVQPTHFC